MKTAREIAEEIVASQQDETNPYVYPVDAIESALKEYASLAFDKGYKKGLLRGAEIAMRFWKSAINTKESGFKQNLISHGCIASAEAISKEAEKL